MTKLKGFAGFSEKYAILLFGKPASGKGEQAKILCSQYDQLGTIHPIGRIPYLNMGAVLRTMCDLNNEIPKGLEDLYREVRRQASDMANGSLMSCDLILSLSKNYLETMRGEYYPYHHPVLLFDGIPRTLKQFFELRRMLMEKGVNNIISIYIRTSDDVCRARVKERLSKQNRPDDNQFEVRLQYYYDTFGREGEQGEKLIDAIRQCSLMHTVNGEGSMNDVSSEIMTILRVLRIDPTNLQRSLEHMVDPNVKGLKKVQIS